MMKAKTIIIIGAIIILLSILLFFLSPLFVPYCGVAYTMNACLDAVTGKEGCQWDSDSISFWMNCADFYQNLAPVLFIIGVCFIIVGIFKIRRKRNKLKNQRK